MDLCCENIGRWECGFSWNSKHCGWNLYVRHTTLVLQTNQFQDLEKPMSRMDSTSWLARSPKITEHCSVIWRINRFSIDFFACTDRKQDLQRNHKREIAWFAWFANKISINIIKVRQFVAFMVGGAIKTNQESNIYMNSEPCGISIRTSSFATRSCSIADTGPPFTRRRHRLIGIGIPIINLGRSSDRLRFITSSLYP